MKSLPQNKRGLFSFATAMLVSLVSLTGTQMTIFAVVAWAWQVSYSTSATGLVTVISFATIVASSVFIGAGRFTTKKLIGNGVPNLGGFSSYPVFFEI